VRDDGADVKYRKDAALSAVYAWMRVREEEVRLGRIPDLKPLRSDEREGRKAADAPERKRAAPDRRQRHLRDPAPGGRTGAGALLQGGRALLRPRRLP